MDSIVQRVCPVDKCVIEDCLRGMRVYDIIRSYVGQYAEVTAMVPDDYIRDIKKRIETKLPGKVVTVTTE